MIRNSLAKATRYFAVAAILLTTCAGISHAQQSAAAQSAPKTVLQEQPDKYTWLEDIHGEKPMAW